MNTLNLILCTSLKCLRDLNVKNSTKLMKCKSTNKLNINQLLLFFSKRGLTGFNNM